MWALWPALAFQGFAWLLLSGSAAIVLALPFGVAMLVSGYRWSVVVLLQSGARRHLAAWAVLVTLGLTAVNGALAFAGCMGQWVLFMTW